ncbi:hypothetical protein Tco_0133376 [Tanacetum coccineum]
MLHAYHEHGLTKGTIIQIFYHGLDDPTQGILDVGGIFLHNTPNEPFKILEDKVLLKLDFLDDSQNLKPKIIESAGGSNINSDHAILMDKFEALTRKINSEFLIIRKELKEMRDGRKDNQASQIYMRDDTPMCDPMEANYVQRYHGGYHDQNFRNSYSTKTDCTVHIPYTNTKTFTDDVSMNHVGDKELKSFDGVGAGKEIKKDDMGLPKEPNKEWKQNVKTVPHNKEVYHYLWHPTEISHLNPGNVGGCLEVKSIDLTRLC